MRSVVARSLLGLLAVCLMLATPGAALASAPGDLLPTPGSVAGQHATPATSAPPLAMAPHGSRHAPIALQPPAAFVALGVAAPTPDPLASDPFASPLVPDAYAAPDLSSLTRAWAATANASSAPANASSANATKATLDTLQVPSTTGILSMDALGDVDGDGHADVLAQRLVIGPERDEHAQLVRHNTIQALAGPDLKRVLWSLPVGKTSGYTGFDLSANGGFDVLVSDPYTYAVASTAPTPAGPTTTTLDLDAPSRYLDGKDASLLAPAHSIYNVDSTRASTFTPTYAYLDRGTYGLHGDSGFAPGRLISANLNESYTQAYSTASVQQTDITIGWTISDLKGTALGSATYTNPSEFPLGITYVPLAKLDRLDAVVRTFADDHGAAVQGIDPERAVGTMALHALASADGHSLWSWSADNVLAAMSPTGLGDVDGDGHGDVAMIIQVLDTNTPGTPYHTLILSGADGHALTDQVATTPTYVARFGDMDGDHKDEILVSASGSTIGVAGMDLKPKWSFRVNYREYALNPNRTPTTGYAGFTDVTGDGYPDFLLAASYEKANGTVRVVDGHNGATAWRRDLVNMSDDRSIGDFTGKGHGDYALLQVTGPRRELENQTYTHATLKMTVFAGETGEVVLERTLIDPVTKPMAGGADRFTAYLDDLGDLAGDQKGSVSVDVRTGTDFKSPKDRSMTDDEYADAQDGFKGEPQQEWLVITHHQELVVAAAPSVPNAKGTLGPGSGTGAAPGGEAASIAQVDASPASPSLKAKHKSPGLDAAILGAGLVVAALAVRRKQE